MLKRLICFALCLMVASGVSGGQFFSSAIQASASKELTEVPKEHISASSPDNYFGYFQTYQSSDAPVGFIEIDGSSPANAQNRAASVADISGRRSAVIGEGNDWCEWRFRVPSEGNYGIWLDYYTLPGKGKDVLLSLTLDDKMPYAEAESMTLPRAWKDQTDGSESGFALDGQGNHIQPEQVEDNCWQTKALTDVQGLYAKPYFLHLTEGEHTIRLSAKREAVAIGGLRLGNRREPDAYSEYITAYSDKKIRGTGTTVLQAEEAFQKSGSHLYPTYDRGNAATQPNDAGKLRLNTIGQENWSNAGDSISWKVNVPKAGLYKLAFRTRQSYSQGMQSIRSLTVNGELPFAEAENIAFPYSQKWYIQTLGGNDPYFVYLEPGDILTLTATTGTLSEVLRNVRQGLLDLNDIYRRVIQITSTDPDIYRDYSLESQIPSLGTELLSISDFLKKTADLAEKIIGTRGSQAAELDYIIGVLRNFAYDPEGIPERLEALNDAINSLGVIVSALGKMPLELDYIAFMEMDAPTPKANAGFYNDIVFAWKQFSYSFANDYGSVSGGDSGSGKAVKVWVSTGRDQARIIKNLITDRFTKDTGIIVDLNVVDTSATLAKASLAGKGPDAALFTTTPMELAYRDALVNLNEYDLSDIQDEFYEQTWVPYRYNGGLYALPETQSFDVMFYRSDVLSSLGLKVPSTWDEFYKVMEVLQKNNLEVSISEISNVNIGVSDGIFTFDKFLLQNDGSYYTDGQTATTFSSETAYAAFDRWVKLYRELGLPRQHDFLNRFRVGEMPLGIHKYTSYNQIYEAAPEIRGLWSIAPIPGTVKADGRIDRSESCISTGCIMLKSAKEKGIDKQTFQFLKWWVSSQTQATYGQKLEATLGVAARYDPANKEALKQINWLDSEYEILNSQMAAVKPIPAVPGDYLVKRSLTTAFRSVVSGQNSVRQALTICTKAINDEITRKRKEFNLDNRAVNQ